MVSRLKQVINDVENRYMNKLLIIVFMAFSCTTYSQTTAMVREVYGSVIVNKDPRLDLLAAKQAEINKKAAILNRAGHYPGFRIQVANTQNRDEANTIKAEMLRRFPDQKTYLLYQAPYFRVRVGNFLSIKEGGSLRKMIIALYPNKGIFFVRDTIEYTPPEEEDITQ
jgi:hypothetical protein